MKIDILTEIMLKHGSDKAPEPPYGHHYTPHYHKWFEPLRNENIVLLEVGVGGEDTELGGKSLLGWREYFPHGKIYGIDIYDKRGLDGERLKTFMGSQDDPKFLNAVIGEIGSPDIIIDDASHINKLTIKTFELLFPRLKKGGIYVIEDLECAYRWDFGGSVKLHQWDDETIVNYLFKMTHHINSIHLGKSGYVKPPMYQDIHSIHYYRDMCIIKKKH